MSMSESTHWMVSIFRLQHDAPSYGSPHLGDPSPCFLPRLWFTFLPSVAFVCLFHVYFNGQPLRAAPTTHFPLWHPKGLKTSFFLCKQNTA